MSQGTISNDLLTEFQWKAIIDGIRANQCIICIGPEIYTQNNGNTIDGKPSIFADILSEYLKKHEKQLDIKVQENGWFHLNNGGSDGPAYAAIKEFYSKKYSDSEAKELFNKIARIQFHTLLSLIPDYNLRNSFINQKLPYIFDTYTKNEPKKNDQKPSPQIPLVYNLIGELDNRNSLVLTYDDFYDYLESVIKGNSMSDLIKDNLFNAKYFLFIGISFDQWFTHLFMRILKQHHKKGRKNKFATSRKSSDDAIEICTEQYQIKFINSGIPEFINQLYFLCEENGLTKEIPQTPHSREDEIDALNAKINKLRSLIGRNKFKELFENIKMMLKGFGPGAKKLLNHVILLESQHNAIKERAMLDIITTREEFVEYARLGKKCITLIEKLTELFNLS